MYKQFLAQLTLCCMILGLGIFSAKVIRINQVASTPAFKIGLEQEVDETTRNNFFGMMRKATSGQRVVEYNLLEKKWVYDLSDEDYEALLKIVEAEAGTEDKKGKMLVAGVVLNRVGNQSFPNSVKEVVLQKESGSYQFSPVANGKYNKVTVSTDTVEAVEEVLCGEDVSEGALYFVSRKYADPQKMVWFDQSLTKLFAYGGHEFFY